MKNMLNRLRHQKGSALLISLMIMVGLSLLGLGFVAISETESAIAVNEKNYVQAQAAAETGVKAVIEMFQDATWASSEGILPKNSTSMKVQRVYDTSGNVDYYKGNAGTLMFDFPFRGVRDNRFFGDVDSPDVWIRRDGGEGQTYLDKLNAKMFFNGATTANDQTRISDIRVYGPPWPGATKLYNGGATAPGVGETVNSGWWKEPSSGASRYGIATVRVTAQRVIGGKVVAERSVKAIIAETPFPTVDGAIETSGSLVGQGNFNVYWGKILSEKDMQVNRPAVGMPWPDAKNFLYFEYGYDTTTQWEAGKTYAATATQPAKIHAPDACIAGDPELGKFAFQITSTATTPASWSGSPSCAIWTAGKTIGSTVNDGTVTWTTVAGRLFDFNSNITDPNDTFYKNNGWVYQMLGKSLEDPWLHARARNTLVYGNNKIVPCGDAVGPHPCDYNAVTQDVTTRYSNFFQNQVTSDTNTYPERIEAVFPTMDYEFWKSIAQSSSNQPGTSIYYFKYVGNGTSNDFQGPSGVTHDIYWWLNAAKTSANKPYNGLGAGFYFFDTQNSKNPQFNKGGTLTPDIKINSGSVASPFQMQGYIYLNANNFGSTGAGNLADNDVYQMPGEPYRDVGYREVFRDKNNPGNPGNGKFKILPTTGTTANPINGTLPTGNYSVYGANNGQWDFQDLNDNNQFDVFVADITKGGTNPIKRPDGTTLPTPTYMPVPYFEGCTPPDPTATPAVVGNCSEPHEPYLNMTYPVVGSPQAGVKIEWYAQGGGTSTYRKPKLRTGLNTVNTCDDSSATSDCTSNAYDQYGARVSFAPILVGALYNEGGYAGSGNATYYGALLMRGSFNATGTPDVYFDECLAKGCLETQLKMQRVMVTSMETD